MSDEKTPKIALGPPWCEWKRKGFGDWLPECTQINFYMQTDSPADSGFIYCPFCGDPLSVLK